MRRSGFRSMGLAWRMAILVIAGSGAILAAVLGYSTYHAERMLEAEIQQKAAFMAQATAHRIETIEYSVEKVTEGIALAFEDGTHASREGLYRVLEKLLRSNPEIAGASVAFARPAQPNGLPLDVPYVYRGQDTIRRKNLGDEANRYESWDWFTRPRARKQPVWTAPYLDQGGADLLMVTYAVPFYAMDGRFDGVVTCDVALDWLRDHLATLPLGESGYAMLVAGDGTLLAHPRRDWIMRANLLETADRQGNAAMRRLGERMLRGEHGIGPASNLLNGQPSWFAFAAIPSPGWSLGVVLPQDEALAPLVRLTRVGILIGVAGFALLLLVVLAIARSITRPLRELDHAVRTLTRTVGPGTVPAAVTAANGLDGDDRLPEPEDGDEVARLSASFAQMRRDLDRYLIELQVATAERERFESELRVAREIQRSLIPRDLPASERYEVCGLLDPTREVGGDFYDYGLMDDDHLWLAIGDVSGKGIPAALFMAVTRTLLKASFQTDDPAATLARVNDALAAENDSMMFVSLFCAVIHLPSGECRYANGGHNPPVLLRDGKADFLPKVQGALVGAMAGIPFGPGRIQLQRGDRLFLYTDGVTEALDGEQAQFGTPRMLDVLMRQRTSDGAALLAAMRTALHDFASDAEQSDDITMLSFRF